MSRHNAPVSPLDAATAARRSGDATGEIRGLLNADMDLREAPWYPPMFGDDITIHFERTHSLPAYTESYLVTEVNDGTPRRWELVFTGCTPDTAEVRDMCGFFAGPHFADPIGDVWLEAGPARLVIRRGDRIIHDGPGTRGPW